MLTDKPYALTFDDIAKLTDYQIWVIYGKERDDKGSQKEIPVYNETARPVSDLVDSKTKFFAMGQALGVPLKDLEESWRKKHGE